MIKYARSEAIATITLNRPEKYNTLRLEMLQEMENALMDANQDDAIKVIVLEGAGDGLVGKLDRLVDGFAVVENRGARSRARARRTG